jgi:hypothetical protein
MVFMLLLAVLRLDGPLASPARSQARRPVHQFDSHGEIILTDPDGRPSDPVLPRETPEESGKQRVSDRKIEEYYYLDNKASYL